MYANYLSGFFCLPLLLLDRNLQILKPKLLQSYREPKACTIMSIEYIINFETTCTPLPVTDLLSTLPQLGSTPLAGAFYTHHSKKYNYLIFNKIGVIIIVILFIV